MIITWRCLGYNGKKFKVIEECEPKASREEAKDWLKQQPREWLLCRYTHWAVRPEVNYVTTKE